MLQIFVFATLMPLIVCCEYIGLQALTACLRIPDWPRRLGSSFAHITAGLGAPKLQPAHLIGSHQWEMPNCTRFSGSAWGLITSQLRRAAISTCLGPVMSATCAILEHLGDERHLLLDCPALADLRLQFSSLLLSDSSVMRRLLWAKDQHEVCRYIIACFDKCHRTDVTLPHPDAIPSDQPCWLPGMNKSSFLISL